MDGTTVFLSLGSNLGDREGNLRAALRGLGPEVRIQSISSLYETAPAGVKEQPDFLNLVVMGETALRPHQLLAHLKAIEQRVGRTATYRWGPRIVDVDIILYGDLVLETPILTIPHREMARRAFVLIPLAEIAPDYIHPRMGLAIADLARRIGDDGVRMVGTPASWSDPA